MERSGNRTAVRPRKKKRSLTLLWIAITAAIVIILLWQEQVALLYVLATLGVAALLTIVAFADLGDARQQAIQPPPFDDSAAISDGISGASVATNTMGATSTRRAGKRRAK